MIFQIWMAISLAAVAGAAAKAQAPAWSSQTGASGQAVVVTSAGKVQAKVALFEKSQGEWQAKDSFDGVIGLNGFAAAGEKREGDKKTPSGIFGFVQAWGYGPNPGSQMPYRQVDDDDKVIDDVDSPDYNKWVRGPTQAKSSEKMKRKDGLYEFGLVVDYNLNPTAKGLGSAIFLHVWRSAQKGTMGCVAIPREAALKLLRWLDPAKQPKIILNPKV